jgi:cytochrome d ubiquinol oxidase subunit II
MKTEGDIRTRSVHTAGMIWYPLAAAAVLFLMYTAFATNLYRNFIAAPAWFIIPATAVAALLGVKIFSLRERFTTAFFASCALIVTVTITGVIGLYPNLIPSNIDPAYNLTIFNSSSSPYTLKIMTVVALLFVPLVIAYQIWLYRIFRHRVSPADIVNNEEGY